MKRTAIAAAAMVLAACGALQQDGGKHDMSFFVTSAGTGNGANLGGIEGADAHCNALAKAAGSTQGNWKAYLSTVLPGGDAGVSARERIGKGPWYNAKGVMVAKNLDDLHSEHQHQQADRPRRERPADQGPRRAAERARHPHRLGPRRPLLDRRRRHHLRQLDEER